MKKELVFRHEYKHQINQADHLALMQRLKTVCSTDCFAGEDGGYGVNSLYFDNADNKALKEKLEGVNHREKFRIRYYNQDTKLIRLEKKSKVNGLCQKLSERITAEECEKLLSGDWRWMCDQSRPLLTELYSKMNYQGLRPKTIISYFREAFVYPAGNCRLTIDSDIRTSLNTVSFLTIDFCGLAVQNPGVKLLEVKYDRFFPDLLRDLIQLNYRETTAFSKYAAGRIFG